MSATAGHVTRKDGRIVEMPERVVKIFRWLVLASLLFPAITLLVSLADSQAISNTFWGMFLSVLPIGLVVTAGVAVLRTGKGGIAAYAGAIALFNFMALSTSPVISTSILESFVTRLVPIIGIGAVLYFLKEDLHYNLRPFWYSIQAMKEMQEMMMKAQARKQAKKEGREYNEEDVMDAEAVIRSIQAKTGQDIPKHMQGLTTRPGFRQQSKKKQGGGGSSAKRKRR